MTPIHTLQHELITIGCPGEWEKVYCVECSSYIEEPDDKSDELREQLEERHDERIEDQWESQLDSMWE